MKYRIFISTRRMMTLKIVLILTVFWFLVVVSTNLSRPWNAIAAPPEAKSLKIENLVFTKNTTNDLDYDPNAVLLNFKKLGEIIGPPKTNHTQGALGTPVFLPDNLSIFQKILVMVGQQNNGFNMFISDMIPVNRTLRDTRDEWCKVPGRYLEDLPQTSVVISFYNEAWSVLLRTVHSVLDRSPAHLLKEIILVDDRSDMRNLNYPLDNYMSSFPKVRIFRTIRREGLIRARLIGARYATAPVLTFLDSNCECTEGWLEPLLDRIARNKTTVVSPVIDDIDLNTFEYHYSNSSSVRVGGFDWDLRFRWLPIPSNVKARRNHTAEPVMSPTIPGIVAINKNFFEKLGTYDSEFDSWGCENLELSFKTWMCGGTLEIVPCSHVGHLNRNTNYLYAWKRGVLYKNAMRLAEVWLDEYAKYYYQRGGDYMGDYGDVTDRRDLRERLGCRSFMWYLKTIYPQQFIPEESVAYGKYWVYSQIGEIRHADTCMDYTKHEVIPYRCHGKKGTQLWLYNEHTKLLKHSIGECMEISKNKRKIVMTKCNESEARQMWNLENFDSYKLSRKLRKKINEGGR